MTRLKQSRFSQYLCVFLHEASAYYTRKKLSLSPMKKENLQTNHPLPQYVMLMNQLSSFICHWDSFDVHIWMSNAQEPPQVYSLLLYPRFFFTYFIAQRFKDILNVISYHIFSHLIVRNITKCLIVYWLYGGTKIGWINSLLRKFTNFIYMDQLWFFNMIHSIFVLSKESRSWFYIKYSLYTNWLVLLIRGCQLIKNCMCEATNET